MQTIIPPEPVFFFTESEGKLFRIMAYIRKDDGDIDVVLDNGRTIKDFNKTKEPDMTFVGHVCPEWIWKHAKRAAETAGAPESSHIDWRMNMFGITIAAPEQEPPKPSDESFSWALEDLLTKRTSDILRAIGIISVKDILLKDKAFMKAKAINESPIVKSEIIGFLAAYGKKIR